MKKNVAIFIVSLILYLIFSQFGTGSVILPEFGTFGLSVFMLSVVFFVFTFLCFAMFGTEQKGAMLTAILVGSSIIPIISHIAHFTPVTFPRFILVALASLIGYWCYQTPKTSGRIAIFIAFLAVYGWLSFFGFQWWYGCIVDGML